MESRPRRDKPLLNQLLFEEWQRTEAEMRALDLDCATSSPTLLIHGIQTGLAAAGPQIKALSRTLPYCSASVVHYCN